VRRRVDAGSKPTDDRDAPACEPGGKLLSPLEAFGSRLAGSYDRHPAGIAVAGTPAPHKEGWSLVDHEELAGVLRVEQHDEAHPLLFPFSDLVLDRIQGLVGRVLRGQKVQLAVWTVTHDRHGAPTLLDLLRDSRPSPAAVTQQVEQCRALCHVPPRGGSRTHVRPFPAAMQGTMP